MSEIREGSGKDILLLHGYLSCKESFYYQIKFLSQYFKVTAPDMPAFGASAKIDFPWSVSDYCDWLSKYIRAAKLENPHIIAHSFGARVALKYLGGGGEGDRLIITGGAGIVKERSAEYLKKVKAYRRIKKLFPKFAEKHFGSEEYRTLSPLMRESYKKIVNEDLKDFAAKIKCKTLLLYGQSDTVTPPDEEGKIFNSLIVDSTLILTRGGHFCFSEYPDAFDTEIFKFLTEI
ncbi:MAG: alpha/beta hydrolase [Clostridia bacterium]|nr:alpha/beta hydrolase [Clostridia bacterium]